MAADVSAVLDAVMTPPPGPALSNWSDTLTYSARALHEPGSVDELQHLVARLTRVKALGTRHSFSTVADTTGDLVSLAALGADVAVDPGDGAASSTASVTAGIRYGVLLKQLQEQGRALHNTGSLPHISVAGATATGTHGSGDGNGILSVAIAAIELVRADGELVTVDRSDPDLAALAVGLGAFGVITRLTLDVEPSYLVRQDAYLNAPWDTVIAELDEIMASAYSVSLLGDFGSPVVLQVWQKTRIAPGESDVPDAVPAARFGGTWLDSAADADSPHLNPRGGVVGPWSERMPHFRLDSPPSAGGDELQSEYFVDRRHGAEALQAMRRMGGEISPHLHAAEIRTVAADDLWLSPAHGRDSLCIGFTWRKKPAEVAALLPRIEEALAPFEPRPHWGKLFALPAADLAARFDRLADAGDLIARYDPGRKFWNPFLELVFG